jgi:hypothetical protein
MRILLFLYRNAFRWGIVWIAFAALVIGGFGQAVLTSGGQQHSQPKHRAKLTAMRLHYDDEDRADDMALFGVADDVERERGLDRPRRGRFGPKGFGPRADGPEAFDALMDFSRPMWFGIPSGFGEDFDRELRVMWGEADAPDATAQPTRN